MDYKYDFSWGDTRALREIMSQAMSSVGITANVPWHNFGYPAHEGDPDLILYTRKIVENLTGHEYKYILITNGATHALNAFIWALKIPGYGNQNLLTNKMYFLFYPGIATNHGLMHIPSDDLLCKNHDIAIVDSPSNPEGRIFSGGSSLNTVWDAAYYTPAYCGVRTNGQLKCVKSIPNHMAMAGSFNKLTGINGLRVGWLATDNISIYQNALEYIEHDICGVSYPSQHMALQIMKYIDLDKFYSDAKNIIDSNKTEIAKLGHIFGNQPIPQHGMFALFEIDKKLSKLLGKASVKFMPGSACGDTRNSARFNLSNSNQMTKEMIKAVLKADSRYR